MWATSTAVLGACVGTHALIIGKKEVSYVDVLKKRDNPKSGVIAWGNLKKEEKKRETKLMRCRRGAWLMSTANAVTGRN